MLDFEYTLREESRRLEAGRDLKAGFSAVARAFLNNDTTALVLDTAVGRMRCQAVQSSLTEKKSNGQEQGRPKGWRKHKKRDK